MAGYTEPVRQGTAKEDEMKRILAAILALVILTLASCEGVYTPPTAPPTEPCPPHLDADSSGVCDKCGAIVELPPEEDPGDSDEPFTVKLTYNGEDFIPEDTEAISVQWTDGFAYHTATLETGVATATGLDGDYRVTLSRAPEGYAYDPNAYVATNDSRNVEIQLQKITKIRGGTSTTGSGLYNCYKINGTGVYSLEIKRASQIVYYEFSPSRQGTYTIESWVDTTENSVNPAIDVYYGTFAAKYFSYTLDGGGPSSSYTKNFSYEIEIGDGYIGNSYTFGVKLSEISGRYPENMVFVIKRNGNFDVPATEYEMIIPTERFEMTPEYDKSRYTYTEAYSSVGGVKLYDGDRFGYNAERGCY